MIHPDNDVSPAIAVVVDGDWLAETVQRHKGASRRKADCLNDCRLILKLNRRTDRRADRSPNIIGGLLDEIGALFPSDDLMGRLGQLSTRKVEYSGSRASCADVDAYYGGIGHCPSSTLKSQLWKLSDCYFRLSKAD
jgi:hypothetical protein